MPESDPEELRKQLAAAQLSLLRSELTSDFKRGDASVRAEIRREMAKIEDDCADAIDAYNQQLVTFQNKINDAMTRMSTAETRISTAETRLGSAETRISATETRISTVETRVGTAETRITGTEKQLNELANKDEKSRTRLIDTLQTVAIWVGAIMGTASFIWQAITQHIQHTP